MRAEKIKEHPAFALMKQTDIQKNYYLQMPLWMFSDPRYAEISLDAKVTYMFLLNRFQLSRRKGWINEQGEVFVVFPRLALPELRRAPHERIIWLCTAAQLSEEVHLPPKHYLAVRQSDGTHRYYGSEEPQNTK